jgi:acetyl-CoA carboxylase biotin carboxyl carrier protein
MRRKTSPDGKPSTLDRDMIRELAALLDETGLTEIEYEAGDMRVRVSRQSGAAFGPYAAPPPAAPTPPADAPAAPKAADASHPGAVTSPMVGTVYLAPEPGAANFVAPGDSVRDGQTLMLVEAMKTFNEIKAPRAGIVREIVIENGAPVEYGELLLIIE